MFLYYLLLVKLFSYYIYSRAYYRDPSDTKIQEIYRISELRFYKMSGQFQDFFPSKILVKVDEAFFYITFKPLYLTFYVWGTKYNCLIYICMMYT